MPAVTRSASAEMAKHPTTHVLIFVGGTGTGKTWTINQVLAEYNQIFASSEFRAKSFLWARRQQADDWLMMESPLRANVNYNVYNGFTGPEIEDHSVYFELSNRDKLEDVKKIFELLKEDQPTKFSVVDFDLPFQGTMTPTERVRFIRQMICDTK